MAAVSQNVKSRRPYVASGPPLAKIIALIIAVKPPIFLGISFSLFSSLYWWLVIMA